MFPHICRFYRNASVISKSTNAFTSYKLLLCIGGFCQERDYITDIKCVKLRKVCLLVRYVTRIRKEVFCIRELIHDKLKVKN